MREKLIFYLTGFLAIFIINGNAYSLDKSCYKSELKRCLEGYKKAQISCKKSYQESKPKCRSLREKKKALCSEQRNKAVCSSPDWKAVNKKYTLERDQEALTCNEKLNEKREKCEEQYLSCRKLCYKNCTECNDAEIRVCKKDCLDKKVECLYKASDDKVSCRNAITEKYKAKETEELISLYKDFYNCLFERQKNYLICSSKAYKKERDCINASAATFRQCLRKSKADYNLCKSEAKAKCAK